MTKALKFLKWLVFGGTDPRLVSRRKLSSEEIARVKKGWREVEELVKLGGPSRLRHAVIKADKLLGYVLTAKTGQEATASALKASKELFFTWEVYDGVWKAHKLRNMLVHDIKYEPLSPALMHAIKRFRIAIREVVDGL